MSDEPENRMPKIIIYETDDKVAKVSVRLEDETVWLTQQQLAELYDTSCPNVTMHIRNIFADGELLAKAVCKKYLQTAAEVIYNRADAEKEFMGAMSFSGGRPHHTLQMP